MDIREVVGVSNVVLRKRSSKLETVDFGLPAPFLAFDFVSGLPLLRADVGVERIILLGEIVELKPPTQGEDSTNSSSS